MKPEKLSYDIVLSYLPEKRLEIKRMFGHQCAYFDGLMVMFFIAKPGSPDNGSYGLLTHIQSVAQLARSGTPKRSFSYDYHSAKLLETI